MSILDAFQDATEKLGAETQRLVMEVFTAWKAGRYTQPQAELAIVGIINRANASAVTLADVYVARQIEQSTGLPTSTTGVVPVDASVRLAAAVHTIFSEPPKQKFSVTDVADLIASAALNPKYYDLKAITARVNEALREHLPDPGDEGYVGDDGAFSFEDFVETVAEHPRKLSEIGLFPPPPRNTPEHDQWEHEVDEAQQVINSDDYDHHPPIWEPEPDGADMRLERLARAEPLDTAQQASVEAMRGQDVVLGWTRQMDADPCELCRFWWRNGYVWPKEKDFQRHKGCNCQPQIVLAEHTQERIAS